MPFENTPDPLFLYCSRQHDEALMRLIYAISERKGAAMLTGVFGCGKTLLAQTLLERLGEGEYKTAFISYPQLSDVELLMAITEELGAPGLPRKKTELLANLLIRDLKEILFNNMKDGRETVIIIDEAHIIEDKKIFEELRLLLNFQLKRRFLLTLLLLGQPELREKVGILKELEQRIAIRCHLDCLTPEETSRYIAHRLGVAGGKRSIFSEEAVQIIHDRSGGIPRRINNLCDLSLLAGFGRKVAQVDKGIVKEAAQELDM